MHNIFYKELNSRKTKNSKVQIFIENLKVNLEDVKIIDKISLFYLTGVKTVLSFPFQEYALTEIMDNQKSEISKSLDVYLKNFEAVVNSIDPLTNIIYNRLYLKIDLLSLSLEENTKVNKMELSVFYLTFGFEFSQNYDYPLIILPVCELNIDNMHNTIRINVPNKKIKKLKNKYPSDNPLTPADNLYISDLDRFILETKSFTLFLNFNYLNTFYKIFENFWRRSAFVKKYFFGKKDVSKKNKNNEENLGGQNVPNSAQKKQRNSLNKKRSSVQKSNTLGANKNFNQISNINTPLVPLTSINISKITPVHDLDFSTCLNNELTRKKEIPHEVEIPSIRTNRNNPNTEQPFKLLLTVFDFKIIYLLQYKNEHNSIFKFHTEVKEKGYFGYIIRFYSVSLKYLNDTINVKRDELKLNTNLFTVSFLHEDNFNDDKFFSYDKEIKFSRFYNLKLQKNFNEFMELPHHNKYRLINNNFFKFFYYEDEELGISSLSQNQNQENNNFGNENYLLRNERDIIGGVNTGNYKLNYNNFNTNNYEQFSYPLNQGGYKQNTSWNNINTNTNKNYQTSNFNNNNFYSTNNQYTGNNFNHFYTTTSNIRKSTTKGMLISSDGNMGHIPNSKHSPEYVDLIFDYKHTLMKVFDITFKRDTMSVRKIEEIYIVVNNLKITWNKFNMDVLGALLFNDVLLIVDKIILKIDSSNKNEKKSEEELPLISVVDLGRFNFVFELNEPQICIQNEIKNSKVLLATKNKCSVKISKICVNENSKDFKLEIQLNSMILYVAPNYMYSSYIYWIGESDENVYYLEEKLFNKMLETPKIQFLIYENIQNNPTTQKADCYTNLAIAVEKIAADFGNTYFNHFLNIIEVFIFDRGYSYAEQKHNIDSRAKDLELFRLDEIKHRIKMNTSSFISNKKSKMKEISFTLKDVVLTMLKENKEIIKLMMRNFEGEHIIYTDKSSETSINVKNLKILDLFKNKNETILTPNFEIQNIGDFENKIDLVTFRKKDSYVSSKFKIFYFITFFIIQN
jgi:hypothetical protein